MKRTQYQGHPEPEKRMGGFYRRSRRARVKGFSCDIADGHRLHEGAVADVSLNGFKMIQAGETFPGDKHCYRTVLSGAGKHFKVLAKPCWRKASSEGVEIGFKILDVSWEWAEMILTKEGNWADAASVSGKT